MREMCWYCQCENNYSHFSFPNKPVFNYGYKTVEELKKNVEKILTTEDYMI